MNLLSVLSKLDVNDICHIRCWLRFRDKDLDSREHYYDEFQVPADVAFLKKETLREGAETWIKHFNLPSQLTHPKNVTAETARKIFGEGS